MLVTHQFENLSHFIRRIVIKFDPLEPSKQSVLNAKTHAFLSVTGSDDNKSMVFHITVGTASAHR